MLTPKIEKETDYDLSIRSSLRDTPFGEYVGAKFSEGLDWTFLKRTWDELDILKDEQPRDVTGDFFQALTGEPKRLTEDEWRESEYFREDIPYQDNMSEARAKAFSENYDMRRYRDRLIDRSPPGSRSIIGFGAMLAAQALDPINYLPMLGAAGKARMIATFGRMGGRVSIGASEAMLGAAVVEPFLINSLAAQGEDVGWTDAVIDIMFSAAIGSLFGAGSHYMKTRRVNSLRKRLAKRDRESLGLTLEKALADTDLNDPVDVGKMADDSEVRLRLKRLIEEEGISTKMQEPESYFRFEEVEGGKVRLIGKEEYINALRVERLALIQGDPGGRIKLEQYGPDTGEMVGYGSTYPEWFRNQGWSAKDAIQALEKAIKGEDLTIKQSQIVDAAGRYIQDLETDAALRLGEEIERDPREILSLDESDYYQLVRILREDGYATETIEDAWKTHAGENRAESFENIKTELEGQGFKAEPDEINAAIDQAINEIEAQDRAWFSGETRKEPDFRAEPVDPAPDLRAAEESLKEPDTVKRIAQDMEIDLKSGEFPELAEIENLQKSGKLNSAERDLLALADENIKKATRYEQAFKVASDCAIRH